jgi:4-amino-4-deoxy-L-arabinose transferase-like glycosyltransferase
VALPRTDPPATSSGRVELARRPLLVIAGAVTVLLLATSWRYGFHRDELYFLVAGRHPDWGYPDQPPLTPVLIRFMDLVGGGSIVVIRLPSALAGGATALLAGLTAREMGGGRRPQLLAAVCVGVSATTLVTGHIVSTTTYDVLFSATITWLLARSVRTGENWLLLPTGLALGLGLLNKSLIGVLGLALLVAIAIAGPRRLLRSGWLWAGASVVVVCAAPYLVWQGLNGWPQLDMAGSIAGGDAQGGRIGFIPFQLLLVSPVLAPIWIAGLLRVLRSGPGRPFRFLGLAYLFLAVVYLLAGGKAYYLAGMYPALIAAGSIPTEAWVRRSLPGRERLVGAAVGLSLVVSAVVGLAVLPARALPPVLAVNPDAGEQVAWPRYVDQIAAVWTELPGSQRATGLVLTQNYGEAGAIDRYGPARGLPAAYSGHNGFADWAQPFGQAGPVLLVGYSNDSQRGRLFGACQQKATLDNGLGLDTQEQGVPIWVCGQPPRPWAETWQDVRHLS